MARKRRIGSQHSETRSILLEITERVMVEDGYAAVSSRRIAKEADVTPALVHYYFPTLDDLFVELLRWRGEQNAARHRRLLESSQPLRALWRFQTEPAGAAFLVELLALANHRKAIGAEIARYAEDFRRTQLEVLADRLDEYHLEDAGLEPATLLVLMTALSRALVQEQAIGVKTGVRKTLDLVQYHLERLEGPAKADAGDRTSAKRRSRAR